MRGIPEWFPGAGFHRIAKDIKEKVAQQRALPHDWVCEQMVGVHVYL